LDYTRCNDETLLLLIARSQENALSELYDRYNRLIYSVALNTLSDPGRAEEVTPEVFERGGDLSQRQQRIRRAVARLPMEQKQAVGMSFFQGLSHPEIAQALNQPLGTIKTRIRLGMQKLRDLLQ